MAWEKRGAAEERSIGKQVKKKGIVSEHRKVRTKRKGWGGAGRGGSVETRDSRPGLRERESNFVKDHSFSGLEADHEEERPPRQGEENNGCCVTKGKRLRA